MPDRKSQPKTLLQVTPEALFRWQVVSSVKASLLRGESLADAVRAAATETHVTVSGEPRVVHPRSLYRWLADGITGLGEDAGAEESRPLIISQVLPEALVEFLRREKAQDRFASVPELIRRARLLGVVAPDLPIDRTSVWRACRRMDLPLRRVPAKSETDQRRFAYPHRMMMTLCDGKHFRAGPRRTRRVALFFLDDASRFGLDVVVGTAESAVLFLRGLHRVIARFGFMDVLFLDRGPGFKADDTLAACRRLEVHLVLGRAHYPEGHGKIERFNQTAHSQVLRGLSGAADVSDDCGALELRLGHYLAHQYNQQPHEGLDGVTPKARWDMDSRLLRFPADEEDLCDRFVVSETRKVSPDNVISVDSLAFEVPRGHASTQIPVWRRLLTGELLIRHDGQLTVLHPVDLAHNAVDPRARPKAPSPHDDEGTPTTAAQIAFSRDLGPVVGPDGSYRPPTRKE